MHLSPTHFIYLYFFLRSVSRVSNAKASQGPFQVAPMPEAIGASNEAPDLDLASFIQRPSAPPQQLFIDALRIINDLDAAPSCNRLAGQELVDTCRTLETSTPGNTNLALDQIKSVFAARLAVCELTGANANVPQQCLPMIPRPQAQSRGISCLLPGSRCTPSNGRRGVRILGYPSVSESMLRECLRALESRPQWWTSYSNARQNAVVICHATRNESDRAELLELYRSLAGVTANISETLANSVEETNTVLSQQREFAKAVESFQVQLREDLAAEAIRAQGTITDILGRTEACLESLFRNMLQSADILTNKVYSLNSAIQQSSDEVLHVHVEVRNILEDIARRDANLLQAQKQSADLNLEDAMAIRNSLSLIQDKEVGGLSAAVQMLQNKLMGLETISAVLHERYGLLDERIIHFDKSLERLQDKAAATTGEFEKHADAQKDLMSNFQVNMKANEELASQVRENLANINVLDILFPYKRVGLVLLTCVASGVVCMASLVVSRKAATFTIICALVLLLPKCLHLLVKPAINWSVQYVTPVATQIQSALSPILFPITFTPSYLLLLSIPIGGVTATWIALHSRRGRIDDIVIKLEDADFDFDPELPSHSKDRIAGFTKRYAH